MQLPGNLFAQLQNALIDAFPSPGDLSMMVRFGLNENLNRITAQTNLNQLAYDLIRWAEAKDRVGDLVRAACTANDTNQNLQAAAQAVTQWLGSQGVTQRPVTPPTPAGTSKPVDPRAILPVLTERFDLNELQTLCFNLGVDYQNLEGDSKDAKARNLIQFMKRRVRLDELVQAICTALGEDPFSAQP